MKRTELRRKTRLKARAPMKRNAKRMKRSPVSGSERPNARQKKWHLWLREQGCAVCGQPAEIHHCVGSTGRHNKIHIGQDFVIPLCPHHHRHGASIDKNTRQFVRDYYGRGRKMGRKDMEKLIFRGLLAHHKRLHDGQSLVPIDVEKAIENYHR